MVSERLEVRLDEEHRRKLSWLAEEREAPLSLVVRQAIDHLYEEAQYERRRLAVERIAAMNIEVPDDPAELNRQLAEAHDPGLP